MTPRNKINEFLNIFSIGFMMGGEGEADIYLYKSMTGFNLEGESRLSEGREVIRSGHTPAKGGCRKFRVGQFASNICDEVVKFWKLES